MPTTPAPTEIIQLLRPYFTGEPTEALAGQLALYLGLLLRWNQRTNLTSVRAPVQIAQTHFGESIFAAQHLPPGLASLLDFGSGAGFPGLPIQLCHPGLQITLAESQGKKAAFLREVVRTLQLSTTVFHGRAQSLPPDALFSAVTLRAVDHMPHAVPAAVARLAPGGWLILLTSNAQMPATQAAATQAAATQPTAIRQQASPLLWLPPVPVPNSDQRVLLLAQQP